MVHWKERDTFICLNRKYQIVQKTLSELVSEFSKVHGHKVKTSKSILFHYIAMNN